MSQPDAFTDELRKIEAAFQAQEGLRGILTDEQIETTLVPLIHFWIVLWISMTTGLTFVTMPKCWPSAPVKPNRL